MTEAVYRTRPPATWRVAALIAELIISAVVEIQPKNLRAGSFFGRRRPAPAQSCIHRAYNRWVNSDDVGIPETLLPLTPAAFHILLSLAAEDRHGYAIIQDVAARTGGEVQA